MQLELARDPPTPSIWTQLPADVTAKHTRTRTGTGYWRATLRKLRPRGEDQTQASVQRAARPLGGPSLPVLSELLTGHAPFPVLPQTSPESAFPGTSLWLCEQTSVHSSSRCNSALGRTLAGDNPGLAPVPS